jgi:hypothetical protein
MSWTDANGYFWIFGGKGSGFMGDIWRFNPSTSQWAWVIGNTTTNFAGTYPAGTGSSGLPRARWEAVVGNFGGADSTNGDLWILYGDGTVAAGWNSDYWLYH